MHERVLAERKAIAQEKIVTFAALIAQKQGLAFDVSLLTVANRDPELQSLFRMEAVAVLLRALAMKFEIEMPVVPQPQAEAEAPQAEVKAEGDEGDDEDEEVKPDALGRGRG